MGFPIPRMSSPNHLQTLPSETDSSPAAEPSLHERLVDMNLEALNYLWEGSGETAATVLRAAIDLVLSTHGNIGSRSSSSADNNTTGAPVSSSTTWCPPPFVLRVSLSALELLPGILGEEDHKSMDHDGFHFYRHVFSLEYDDSDDDNSDSNVEDSQDATMPMIDEPSTSRSLEDWDLPTLGAVFLYNLGMICHEVAVIQADLTALAQAQTLYRSALSLLLSSSSSPSYSPEQPQVWSVDQVRILLALYTNLGHAATFLQDRVTLAACYNGLHKLLGEASVWMPPSSSSSTPSSSEEETSLPAWTDLFVQSMSRAHSYQLRYASAA
eukprot:scaffold964_cov170-Amphora_coffeaeformis.AAC.1